MASKTPKKRKRWLLRIAILAAVLLAFARLAVYVADEPRPQGIEGEPADQMARQIELAINKADWDTVAIVQWQFAGAHKHLWDRSRHLAQVSWGEKKVQLDLNTRRGMAWENGVQVSQEKVQDLVDEAWSYWVNDAFWLNPLAKLFDEGTTRELVDLKEGKQGLLISYAQGGATPGDSYLWIIDPETKRPNNWKMWVGIIPIGGLEMAWNGWIQIPGTQSWVSTTHDGSIYTLVLDGIKGAYQVEDMFDEDPFAPLLR